MADARTEIRQNGAIFSEKLLQLSRHRI